MYRRQGVGRVLLQQAIQWASDKQLAGVMLETQNNNVGGCRLYESCGFELGGFDRCLYQGINPGTDEIALYWYYPFETPA
jgi:ribosomal protein S18 acetylase RimI-like enzyme